MTCTTPNRSTTEFVRMIQRVVGVYPHTHTIHRVMDTLNIHCEKSLTDHRGRRLGRRLWRRLPVHFTPKHGSWLSQADIEPSLVSRRCLGRRRIGTLTQLRADICAWNTRAQRAKTRIH